MNCPLVPQTQQRHSSQVLTPGSPSRVLGLSSWHHHTPGFTKPETCESVILKFSPPLSSTSYQLLSVGNSTAKIPLEKNRSLHSLTIALVQVTWNTVMASQPVSPASGLAPPTHSLPCGQRNLLKQTSHFQKCA